MPLFFYNSDYNVKPIYAEASEASLVLGIYRTIHPLDKNS